VILSFSSNTTLIEYQQTLTISAVLTDPDGIDDLIGGVLIDPTSGNSYGSFATAAAEGSYMISVPWSQLNTVVTINVDLNGANRTLRAEFFDAAGMKVTRDLVVKVRCNSPGGGLRDGCCNGVQTTMNSNGNCGSCGHGCGVQSGYDNGYCSRCRCSGTTMVSTTRQSCAALCASKGHTCAERDTYSTRAMDDGQTYYVGVGNYTLGRVVVLTTCAEVPAAPAAGGPEYWSYMRCVCAQEAGPSWYSQLPQ